MLSKPSPPELRQPAAPSGLAAAVARMFDHMSIGCMIWDRRQFVAGWNRAWVSAHPAFATVPRGTSLRRAFEQMAAMEPAGATPALRAEWVEARLLQAIRADGTIAVLPAASGRYVSFRAVPLAGGGGVMLHGQSNGDRSQFTALTLLAAIQRVPGSVYQRIMRPDGRIEYSFDIGGLKDREGDRQILHGAPQDPRSLTMHPADREPWLEALRHSARHLEAFSFDKRRQTGAGDWIWTRSQAMPRRLADGSVLWDGLAVDITDLKQAETAAREREARLRCFAESAADWFWESDELHHFTCLTGGFRAASGLGEPDVLGRSCWEICLPHPLACDWEAHRRVLAARQPFRDAVFAWRAADGGLHFASISGVPFHDGDGRFRGYRGIGRDIADEAALDGGVRQRQAFLDGMLRHMPVGLFALDDQGRFTFHTGRLRELLGSGPEAEVGRSLADAFAHLPDLVAAAADALAGRERHVELEISGRVVLVDLAPVRDAAGSDIAVVGVSQDVTKRRAQARTVEASEARFRSLITNLRNIVFCHGAEGDGPFGYSGEGVEVFGIDAERISGSMREDGRSDLEAWYAMLHPEDRPGYIEAERRRKELGEPYTLEFRIVDEATGEIRWLRETAWNVEVQEPQGRRTYFDSYIIDLTDRRRMEAEARASEERYRLLVEHAPIPILLHAGRRCMFANPAAVALLGARSAEELLGIDPMDIIAPDARAMAAERTRLLYEQGGSLEPWEYTLLRRDGQTRVVEARASAFGEHDRRTVQVVLTDVTERKQVETSMRHLAQHDGLTGLPNRVLLLDRLGQAIARARREGQGLALMLVDLDGFKPVNDRLGHDAGDALLRQVAGRATALLRASDTCARIGGDEFAILQTHVASVTGAATLAAKIIAAMAHPFAYEGQEMRIGVSVGVAMLDDAVDPAMLLRRADMALYRAKAEGRGRFAFYEPGMNAAAELGRRLDAELRVALADGRLGVLYQPQVALADGSLIGLEALARWPRADGMLAAEAFISVAEGTGLIRPLGRWVLGEVCRQIRLWREGALEVAIAVNVAASQFRAPGFVDDLLSILAECGLAGTALQLELGEGVLTEPAMAAMGADIGRLRDAGIAIVLDEFGRAPLALERLSQLPVTAVKLERGLVGGIGREPSSERVVAATVAAACSLGLRVIASGVENAAQAEFLRRCGCHAAQGYLFGPPLPAASFDFSGHAGHG